MFKTTPHRSSRRAAITAALTLTAAFAVPAAALAAEAPTIGPPTIIPAGQKTPIDVGGNHLHQHDIIRQGTELVRWPVTMHGKSRAVIALTCPAGTIHSGLGLQEGSAVAFGVAKGADGYFLRTIGVRFYTAPKVDPNGARGHVYALCRDTSIAPMSPAVGFPVVRRAGRRSPVDVAGNHLHQGDTIRKGMQLFRYPVSMLGKSNASVLMFCPKGTANRGLAFPEGSKIDAHPTPGSGYGHQRMKLRFHARPGADAATATGSVYVLCS